MTEAQKAKIYLKIRQDCIHYRGRYIDEAIIMELIIDDVLANYFCKNEKVEEVLSAVFNTEFLALGAKEKILQSILLKPIFKSFWKKYNTIVTDIGYVRKYRNVLAHSKLIILEETLENYDNDLLPLRGTENGKQKKLNIKLSDLDNEIKKVQKCISTLREFRELLHPPKL